MVLPALREENLAKILEENNKKIVVLPYQVGERRKVEKLLKKMFWNSQRTIFKKTWNTIFDWSKNRFDQSNEAEAHINFKARFRLIEKQVRLIEPGRGSLNFLNKISIDQKLDWINRNFGKTAL